MSKAQFPRKTKWEKVKSELRFDMWNLLKDTGFTFLSPIAHRIPGNVWVSVISAELVIPAYVTPQISLLCLVNS